MNWSILILGVVLGIALVVGGAAVMGSQGAPSPADVCENQLGDGWQPNGVQTDRANNTVYITCQAENGTTERVTTELNVLDDVLGEKA